jgi:hypothetical protein
MPEFSDTEDAEALLSQLEPGDPTDLDPTRPQSPPSPSAHHLAGEAAAGLKRHLNLMRILRKVAIGSAFMFTGPMLIVVNSYLLNARFPYPMLLCAVGVGASGLFAKGAVWAGWGAVSPGAMAYVSGPGYIRAILPVCFFMGLSIGSGNAAYLYLDVGIIQMLKAATPVTKAGSWLGNELGVCASGMGVVTTLPMSSPLSFAISHSSST